MKLRLRVFCKKEDYLSISSINRIRISFTSYVINALMKNFEIIGDILFLDIETVSEKSEFSNLSLEKQALWIKKANQIEKDFRPEELYKEKAGIYAEFGKIVAIALGYLVPNNEGRLCLRIKAFYHKEEKLLLKEFLTLMKKFNHRINYLCAHNGKEFDFPYLCRSLLVHSLSLPSLLDMSGKKPWEVCHLDTLELWKFGDRKSYTSLELLTQLFDIPSSKEDIDGSQVGKVFYQDDDLDRIAHYCRKDVLATVQVYLKLTLSRLFFCQALRGKDPVFLAPVLSWRGNLPLLLE